ncbi:hypothetical protein AADG42_14960 [Ammonicoccus fulvus]|uniref:Uncharacterized protein n=1 Tax=Ammonicoccus fulvus TaxID=3138240 RepID=A0ABZ3FT25_9ACTN
MTRLRGALALAICIVLTGLIGLAIPPEDTWPRYRDVGLGEWGDNGRYAARALEVKLARSAAPEREGSGRTVAAPADAVVVVVRAEHTPHEKTVLFTSGARLLGGDGSVNHAQGESTVSEPGPGFVGSGDLIFVVSEEAIAGAHLALRSRNPLFTQVPTDTIRIDLRLSDRTPVEEWVRVTAGETRVGR